MISGKIVKIGGGSFSRIAVASILITPSIHKPSQTPVILILIFPSD